MSAAPLHLHSNIWIAFSEEFKDSDPGCELHLTRRRLTGCAVMNVGSSADLITRSQPIFMVWRHVHWRMVTITRHQHNAILHTVHFIAQSVNDRRHSFLTTPGRSTDREVDGVATKAVTGCRGGASLADIGQTRNQGQQRCLVPEEQHQKAEAEASNPVQPCLSLEQVTWPSCRKR